MTAITWGRSEATEEGVAPFDARRHLRQVAELIGAVFADELDANGRSALQEMQVVSRLSPLLGGLLSTAFFNDFVLGYVWLQDGRVVGNVTFQRSDMSGTRYRISNVAVAPEYRGRGIARALMQATLAEIAERGGSWSVLQVRVDNPPARHLYESLGFTDVCQDGVWQRPGVPIEPAPSPAPAAGLRLLGSVSWQARFDLARAARTPLAHWADPVEPTNYQPGPGQFLGETLGNLTGLQRVWRWGAWSDGGLMGAVEVVAAGMGGFHRLRFDVRPEAHGQLEQPLVAQGLAALAGAPVQPIMVEHSADHVEGVAALEAAGFRPQRILLTMRRLMTPENFA